MLNKYIASLILLLLLWAANISFYRDYEPDFVVNKSSILISRMDSSQSDSLNFDFDKMAHLLEGKEIVMLGESIHYGGTTFKFKTEFVKYLHQKHGFDVILFEAGLYDTYKIKSDTSKLYEALWSFWSETNEMTDLWSYVGANRDIELAGFDVQLSGSIYDKQRAKGIDSLLTANDIVIVPIIDSVMPNIRMLHYNGNNLPKNTQKSIIEELRNIGSNLNSKNKPIDAKYFTNMADWYECVWRYGWGDMKRFHIRDSLMADNLQFQIDNFYKDKKVIVWASNLHANNSNESFDGSYTMDKPKPMAQRTKKIKKDGATIFTAMGERVKERYGNRVFTLCTTFYGRHNGISKLYNRGSNRTMEYQLYSDGYKYAFIDLTNVADSSFMTKVNQGMEYSGKWANMTDAIFYMKTDRNITYKNED